LSKLIMLLHVFHDRQYRQCVEVILKRHATAYLSNLAKDSAPIVCTCSSTAAMHGLSSRPRLSLQAARYNHLHTSRSYWKRPAGCGFDSSTADTLIRTQGRKAGGSSPSAKAPSSFASSFKASRRLRSVFLRFEAPRLLLLCRVVVPDPAREGGAGT
jgi:hypothetical protein